MGGGGGGCAPSLICHCKVKHIIWLASKKRRRYKSHLVRIFARTITLESLFLFVCVYWGGGGGGVPFLLPRLIRLCMTEYLTIWPLWKRQRLEIIWMCDFYLPDKQNSLLDFGDATNLVGISNNWNILYITILSRSMKNLWELSDVILYTHSSTNMLPRGATWLGGMYPRCSVVGEKANHQSLCLSDTCKWWY